MNKVLGSRSTLFAKVECPRPPPVSTQGLERFYLHNKEGRRPLAGHPSQPIIGFPGRPLPGQQVCNKKSEERKK